MLTLYRDAFFAEHRTPPDHPESAERAEAVLAGLEHLPQVGETHLAAAGRLEDVIRVHDADYVASVEALANGGGGPLDGDTWVSPRSYQVALAACGTTIAAAQSVLAAAPGGPGRQAFAVVRPPGHHARPARGMGFCLFNNIAVAAACLRAEGELGRVAIVDFDVHHGNGTQEAFYADPAVFFTSLHRAPFYPGTGLADEHGTGDARGSTLNLPLKGETPPERYQEAFRRALEQVEAFAPELLLVSAGFDAYVDDPIGGLGLEAEHFAWIGAELREVAESVCQGRVVSVLEGGYELDALGELAGAFAQGLTALEEL